MSQGTTVLIIDDSATSCHVMETILQNKGYQVKSVRDGREGLMTVQRELPHCVVLDVVLPGMSGFEVCRNIRANELLHNLPVIMVSTKSTQLDKAWALRQGATHYLVKPFEDDVFVQLVQEVTASYVPPVAASMRQSRPVYAGRQAPTPEHSVAHILAPAGDLPHLEPDNTYAKIPTYRPQSARPTTSRGDPSPSHSSPLHKLIPLRNQGSGGNGISGEDYIRKLYEAIDGQSDIETLCSITHLSREVVMKGLRNLLMQHRIRLREPNGNIINN